MLSTKTAKGTRQVQFRYISPSVPLHWTLPGRKSGTVSL